MESSYMLFINILLGNALSIQNKQINPNERNPSLTKDTWIIKDIQVGNKLVYDSINVNTHAISNNLNNNVNRLDEMEADLKDMVKTKGNEATGYNPGEPKVKDPDFINIAMDHPHCNVNNKHRFRRGLTRKPKSPRTTALKKKKKKKKNKSTKVFDLQGTFDIDEFEKYINERSSDKSFEKDVIKNLGGSVSGTNGTNSTNVNRKKNYESYSGEIHVNGNESAEPKETFKEFGNIDIPDIDDDLTPEDGESSEYCDSEQGRHENTKLESCYEESKKQEKESVKNTNAKGKTQIQQKKHSEQTKNPKNEQNIHVKDILNKTKLGKKNRYEPNRRDQTNIPNNEHNSIVKDISNTTKLGKKNTNEPKRRVKRSAKKGKKKKSGGKGRGGGFDPFGGYGGFNKQKNTNNKYKGGKKGKGGGGGGGGGKAKKKGGGSGSSSGVYMDLEDLFEMGSDDDDDDDDDEYSEVDSESEFSHRGGGRGRGGNQYQQQKNNKQNKKQNKQHNKNKHQNEQQGDGIVREAMKLTEIKENDSIFRKGKIKVVSNKKGVKTEREENYNQKVVIQRLEHLKTPNNTQKRVKRSAVKPKKKKKDTKRLSKGAAKKQAAKAKKSKPRARKDDSDSSEKISREKLKITELKSDETDDMKSKNNNEKIINEDAEKSRDTIRTDEEPKDETSKSSQDTKVSDTNNYEQAFDDDYSEKLKKIDLNEELGVDMNKLKNKYEVDTAELRAQVLEAKDYVEEEKRKKKEKKKGKKDSSEDSDVKKKKKRTTKRKGDYKRRPPTKRTTKKRREKKKVFDYSIEVRDKNKFVKTGIKAIIRELNVSTRCDYCGSGKASIQHVLAGCKMALYFGFYSRRHDRVLQTIRNAFQLALDQTNSSSGIVAPTSVGRDVISAENQTEVNILFLARLRYILSHLPDTNVTKKRGRKSKTTVPHNQSAFETVNGSLSERAVAGNKSGMVGDAAKDDLGGVNEHTSERDDSKMEHHDIKDYRKSGIAHPEEDGGSGDVVSEAGSTLDNMESEEDGNALDEDLEEEEVLATTPMRSLSEKDEGVPNEPKKPKRMTSYEFNENIAKHPNVFIEPDFSRDNPLHPFISNNKIQSIMGLTDDWELYSDNRKSRYAFPIPELQKNTSLLKPDLLLLSPRLKYLLILELTIPWDFNMDRQSTSKAKKYKSLIRALNAKQYNVHFFTIEVGLTGHVGPDLEVLFQNLGLDRTTRQRYLADISNTTLLASHSIWHRKRERKWKFWIFWKKRNQEKYRRKHRRSKSKVVAAG